MFRTPTYYALQLHGPHMGATALPLEIAVGDTLPDGSPAVSGVASRGPDGTAVTLINRHRHSAAEVCIEVGHSVRDRCADVLAADTPAAMNSAAEPERVRPRPLEVAAEGRAACRIELPPHSMATLRLA
jgi:alpha-N-arabinofuranosidase